MTKFLKAKAALAAVHGAGAEALASDDSQEGSASSPGAGPRADDDDPLLRLPEVLKRVPVSRSHWWAGVASGRYPAPVRLSVRCVAWRASSIRTLIASC